MPPNVHLHKFYFCMKGPPFPLYKVHRISFCSTCFLTKSFFMEPLSSTCYTRKISMSACVQQIELRKRGDSEIASASKSKKAKQAAKDTSYALVIIVGLTCMGFVFYILYKELLSKAGPTQVFGDALEKCRRNQELVVALGSPIEGFGEMNSRGRRRHVSHLAYIDAQGRDAMRMKFHIKGSSGRTGTVQVDSVIVRRKISYRYIIAYLDTHPRRIIIILDERSELDRESVPSIE
uniref:mitochondrial import inner membrane translocase subunit Tim21-like n=1 Tax=Styela clava TaxID=7725 RepID=UPI0019398EDC|nr:mitochondrial import inner membrane translocase subunit Tim21-like [Styela clava]